MRLLQHEYAHFLADPTALGRQLDCLVELHGHAVIERWKSLAAQGSWDALVEELLAQHYDPAYTRSIGAHYPQLALARQVRVADDADRAFSDAARALLGEVCEMAQ